MIDTTNAATAARALSDWVDANEEVLGNLEEGAGWLRAEVLAKLLPETVNAPFTEQEMLDAADCDGIACIQGIISVSIDDLFRGIEHFDDIVSEALTGRPVLQDIGYECIGCDIDGNALVFVTGFVDVSQL